MNSPFFSVLITTYNYGPFVGQAVESILTQEFPPESVEVLVVDDGSTDHTAECVKKYLPHVEYLRKENGGQASALNAGLLRARGEIVCLLDADDLFLPQKLRRLADAFQKDPTLGMVYHRLQEWHTETGEKRDWEFVEVSGDLRKTPNRFKVFTPQPTSAIALRRSVLSALLPIPERIRMLADCYLVALLPFVAPVLAIPETLALYRIHGGNQYTKGLPDPMEVRRKKLEMWRVVIAEMRRWLTEHGRTRREVPVRAMLDQWTNILEREEFALSPPGRLRFFRHLLRLYKWRWPLMSGRLRLINAFNTLGSLVVGFEKFHSLDEAREDVTRRLRNLIGKDAASTQPPG